MKRPEETLGTYRTQSSDTDSWAEQILFEHWRGMTPCEKAALVSDLSKAVHRLSLAGLQARFPNESPDEIEYRATCIRLGPELMAQVESVSYRRLPYRNRVGGLPASAL